MCSAHRRTTLFCAGFPWKHPLKTRIIRRSFLLVVSLFCVIVALAQAQTCKNKSHFNGFFCSGGIKVCQSFRFHLLCCICACCAHTPRCSFGAVAISVPAPSIVWYHCICEYDPYHPHCKRFVPAQTAPQMKVNDAPSHDVVHFVETTGRIFFLSSSKRRKWEHQKIASARYSAVSPLDLNASFCPGDYRST